MQNQIFSDVSAIERLKMLESNADDILDDYDYNRVLSLEEIEERNRDYVQKQLEIKRLEAQLLDVSQGLRGQKKRLSKVQDKTLFEISSGREWVTERVFILKDFEEKAMGLYNSRGELIEQRLMRGQDSQMRLPLPQADAAPARAVRTGTDG